MITDITNIDYLILDFIQRYLHNPVMDEIMIFFTHIGERGMIWMAISMVLIISKKYRRVGIMTLSALIISFVLGDVIIKNLVQRDRPFVNLDSIKLLIPPPSSFSFPSGHAASSFAASGVLAANFKKQDLIFIILAALIAYSRMYLYVHFPTDIFGGIILGLICSKIVLVLFDKESIIKLKH